MRPKGEGRGCGKVLREENAAGVCVQGLHPLSGGCAADAPRGMGGACLGGNGGVCRTFGKLPKCFCGLARAK